jgi:hypothetical protein
MKFKRIDLRRLRNEEWFNFFMEFKRFVEATSPEALNIDKLFVVFLSFYVKVDEIIEKILKSKLTPIISASDKKRDNTFRGLVHTIEAAKYCSDTVKITAAKSLDTLLLHYGNLADKPYNEETSGIYNFIQEFRTNYREELNTLDLSQWLDELEKNNNDFEDAILERNKEIAVRPGERLVDVRRDVDRCYRDIIQRLEALMLIEEDTGKYEDFVKTLNANIKRYSDSIAQRKGRAGAANEEYDELD